MTNSALRTCAYCGGSLLLARSNAAYCGLPCRFWSKVAKSGDPKACWRWIAKARTNGGNGQKWYGKFLLNGKAANAHRVAWELTNGQVPAGLSVCHTCDDPLCCNPSHLFLGSQRANMHDCISKGRFYNHGLATQAKDHCRNGHGYTVENTGYTAKERYRICLTCRSKAVKEDRARRKLRGR